MALDDNILITAQKLQPTDAIKLFEKQGLKVTATLEETQKAIQKKLFAITQSINMSVLQDIRDEMALAIREGKTYQSFQKSINNTFAKKGWSGQRTIINAKGKVESALTTPWRLKLIYRQNMQTSLNAGRFQRQILNSGDRPFIELIELLDTLTRRTHRAQSGSIQPITSKFWKAPNSWYPPNGFNCRGRTRSLTRAVAKSKGIGIKAPGTRPDRGFGFNPATESFKPRRKDFDDDIWNAGQQIKPSALSLLQ